MSHDDCRGVQGQRALDDDARMHLRALHRPREQALYPDEPVLVIEECNLEVLPYLTAQPQSEEGAALGDITKSQPWFAGSLFEDA
ncbi:hypothetical protein GGR79_000243 [Xanthomonas arboricola]|nr:hypothetical protein [Xanthomonas arboricola]